MSYISKYPEGTCVNQFVSSNLYNYLDTPLPMNIVVSVPIGLDITDLWGGSYYGGMIGYLPFDRLDFSQTESFIIPIGGTAQCTIIEDVVVSAPKLKKYMLYGVKLNYTTTPNFTMKDLDNIQYLQYPLGTGEYNTVTFEGNSTNLVTIQNLGEAKYTKLYFNVDCSNLTSFSPWSYYTHTETTFMSGFPNLKMSLNGSYTFDRFPNLTYESWVSIIDNLYDFTSNGLTPDSSQGRMKLHANAYNLLTDADIAKATSKGWTLS